MPWDIILPSLIAGLFGITTTALVLRGNRANREASVIVNQATALKTYWDRIEELEADVERLMRDKERLEVRVGQLQMRIDQAERRS